MDGRAFRLEGALEVGLVELEDELKLNINRMCRYVRPQNVSGQDYTSTIMISCRRLIWSQMCHIIAIGRQHCALNDDYSTDTIFMLSKKMLAASAVGSKECLLDPQINLSYHDQSKTKQTYLFAQ